MSENLRLLAYNKRNVLVSCAFFVKLFIRKLLKGQKSKSFKVDLGTRALVENLFSFHLKLSKIQLDTLSLSSNKLILSKFIASYERKINYNFHVVT